MTGTELRNLPAGKYIYQARDMIQLPSSDTVVFTEPEIVRDEFLRRAEGPLMRARRWCLKIFFLNSTRPTLLPASYAELDKVVQFMLEEDIKLIEISGHTDNEGSDAYNQKLSEGRAAAVVSYLASKGVNSDRMLSVGYGESRPIDTNQTEEGQAQNRRVEFTLIRK